MTQIIAALYNVAALIVIVMVGMAVLTTALAVAYNLRKDKIKRNRTNDKILRFKVIY